MPNPAKGPRLYLRAASGTRKAVWLIRDGAAVISTGCAESEVAAAERRLGEYLASKHTPHRDGPRAAAEIPIADVLGIYVDAKASEVADKGALLRSVVQLEKWWGDRMLSAVTGTTCRAYADSRGNRPIARRELENLRAAINFHLSEGLTREDIKVPLPPPPPSRDRWLSRAEAARLIWMAWKWPGGQSKHVARFILVALYTGTRSGAILRVATRPTIGHGYVDYDREVMYRRAPGSAESKKKQPPTPIHWRLMPHLRRWQRLGISQNFIIESKGQPISKMDHGFRRAAQRAGLEGVSPHTLRHTAITWAMQGGADNFGASGVFGVTMQVLARVYAHHNPDHGKGVHAAMVRRNKRP
jgi:integrase